MTYDLNYKVDFIKDVYRLEEIVGQLRTLTPEVLGTSAAPKQGEIAIFNAWVEVKLPTFEPSPLGPLFGSYASNERTGFGFGGTLAVSRYIFEGKNRYNIGKAITRSLIPAHIDLLRVEEWEVKSIQGAGEAILGWTPTAQKNKRAYPYEVVLRPFALTTATKSQVKKALKVDGLLEYAVFLGGPHKAKAPATQTSHQPSQSIE